MNDLDFTPSERLEELLTTWDAGWDTYWHSYEDRCCLAYEIHAETARCGCKGKFSAILRRMKLPSSTAYDMIMRHRVKLGEIKDPDLVDPRDNEEEEEQDDQNDQNEEAGTQQQDGSRESRSSTKRVTIELSGEFAEGVVGVQSFYQLTTAAKTIKFCVQRMWDAVQANTLCRAEELEFSSNSGSKAQNSILTDGILLDSERVEERIGRPALIPYVVSVIDPSGANGESSTT